MTRRWLARTSFALLFAQLRRSPAAYSISQELRHFANRFW
jgi:hypothetical protein